MPRVTYYVAMPFGWAPDDEDMADLAPGEPLECESAEIAVAMAERLSLETVGAIAFSRTGDPDTGVFEDAVILAKFGTVGKVA
jgi:hypothetical protein